LTCRLATFMGSTDSRVEPSAAAVSRRLAILSHSCRQIS